MTDTQATPAETLQIILAKKQYAEECHLVRETADKECQNAYATLERLINTSVEYRIIKPSKVYIVEVAGVKKAIRIVQKRSDRNGRDDERAQLKLEIMDMAE